LKLGRSLSKLSILAIVVLPAEGPSAAFSARPKLREPALTQGSASIAGLVTGAGFSLDRVEIRIDPLVTVTDSAGRFRLTNLPAGNYILRARKLGYWADSLLISLSSGEQKQVAIVLHRIAALDTIRASANATADIPANLRDFERRRHSGFGRFITETEIRKNENQSLGAFLQARISGTRLVVHGGAYYMSSGRTTQAATPLPRGGPRGCWVSIYLDGVALYRGKGERPFDLSTLRASDIAGIEFYSGAATMPIEYNSFNDCGVLLLWTRRRS
jgi:hypothetical protein